MRVCVDLQFQGVPRVIASAVIIGRDGVTVVDPGPTSCLPGLERGLAAQGLALTDVRRILLTHIHLDHAGATGSIVERVPSAEVYVHEAGAPHMVDPARLLASATRLYGAQMDTLWGAFRPVPAERVRTLVGGEHVEGGDRTWRVAYTPGHAKHHVAYLDEHDGTAYVGDTAGVQVSGDYLIAPTPPPDIDIEAWNRSLDLIDGWAPVSLFLTHFGPMAHARAHLARVRTRLMAFGELAQRLLAEPGTDVERGARFVAHVRAEVRAALPEADIRSAELAAPFDQLWQGLLRYWRKREPAN